LANYFRFLIPNFSWFANHLTMLFKKDSKYKEGPLPEKAMAAFLHLRTALGEAPIVGHPRPDGEYLLTADACTGDSENPGGLGAVLAQRMPDDTEVVLAYASRSLKPNEQNYSAYLLEAAASSWAIDHYSVYLRGRRFTLFTDHKPLESLSTIHTKTLNRLQQQMLEYDFDIRYKEGKTNVIADALSRNTVSEIKISALEDETGTFAEAQGKDPLAQAIRAYLADQELPEDQQSSNRIRKLGREMYLGQGCLWKAYSKKGQRTRNLLYTPVALRERALEGAHSSWIGGHSGSQKTAERLLQNFWWPGLHSDAIAFVKNCVRCQQATGAKPSDAPLQSLEICGEPNERVHIDLFGPLKTRSPSGNSLIMVITDGFTKYTELVALPDKSAESCARALFERWICRFGVPSVLVSDRGREFLNETVKQMTEYLGMTHKFTSPFHPQTNASAERYNRTMKSYLTKMLDNDCTLDWERWLPAMMLSYNTQVHRATMESPFFLTFLHDPKLPYFDIVQR